MENANDERGSSLTLLSARFVASAHNSRVPDPSKVHALHQDRADIGAAIESAGSRAMASLNSAIEASKSSWCADNSVKAPRREPIPGGQVDGR